MTDTEWVLSIAVVKRELLDIDNARKLAYGDTICLENEIMQGTMPCARRRGRQHTTWMDNITTWTGFPVEESVRVTEDGDKWTKYVHGAANHQIENG